MTAIHALPETSGIPVTAHEHGWTTESSHRTSEGLVVYVRCTACGTRRVDLRADGGMPPAMLSHPVVATR
ncbi:hypothetical protein [Microbacterium sp.]|uniref:hypothetical protein n=1 Tax=Microbacterium sp. TaxID=51671 RepID=UPI0033417A81